MEDVFFDITIDGQPAGRIVFELLDDIAPKTARNFRELATGQHGFGYKGSRFTWTAPKELIVVGENQTGKRFIYGNTFPAENFLVKHDAPGVLSTVMSSNQATHGSDFFITTAALPQRDGVNVAFGKVTAGIDIVYRINGLNRTFGVPSKPVIIVDCGVIWLLAKEIRSSAWREFLSVARSDSERRKLLKAGEGKKKRALDTVQQLLAFPDEAMSEDDRFSLADLMVSLCEESKSFPTCPTLNGVVRESRPRASGSFGEVWKATLGEYPVCLKVARMYINTDIEGFISAFAKDAIKWRQLVHPNILPFYGVYLLEKQLGSGICLVSPWMVKGNILDYLKLDPETSRAPLVIDMLEGLDYLHRLGIVHGNIKSTNVLISSSGSACLADFGLKGSWDSLRALRWQAPELLGSETDESQMLEPTKKSDMYSITCVMYEVLTGRIPYHEVLRDAMVILKVMSGAQPSKPSSFDGSELTNEIWDVMEQCFKRDPEQRLSINRVLEKLRDRWTNPLTLKRVIAWVRRQRQDDGGPQKTISAGEFDKAARGTVSRLSTADVELLRD